MAKFSALYALKTFQFNRTSFNQASYGSMDIVDSWDAMYFGDFLYDDDNFDGASIYFEAVLRSDGSGTMYAALFNKTPTELSSSEISTTSADNALVRSAALTMTDTHEYHVRTKTSTTLSDAGLAAPRIIADYDKSDASPIEVQVLLWGADFNSWNSDGATFQPITRSTEPRGSAFRYTKSNWSVLTEFYYEANMLQDGTGTAQSKLWNWTDGLDVSGSLVTTTSGTQTRVRSSQIQLIDGKDYVCRYGTSGGSEPNAVYGNLMKLVAVMPKPRKFELHHDWLTNAYDDAPETAYAGYTAGRLRFNPAVWDEDNITALYYETVMEAASTRTIYQQIAYWTSPSARTEITATEISTTSTSPVRVRSVDIKSDLFGLASNLLLKSEWKVSGGSTGNNIISNGKLIFVYDTPPILDATLGVGEVNLEWQY